MRLDALRLVGLLDLGVNKGLADGSVLALSADGVRSIAPVSGYHRIDVAAAPGFAVRPRSAVIPLPETERRAIMDALGFTKGDRGKAARLLQISRTTLYRKLKEYQIGE